LQSQPQTLELARLCALHTLEVLDTAAEAEFDALVQAAAAVCRVPISLISLIDKDRQWFKANFGLEGINETHRDISFCAHTIAGSDLLEVCDTRKDVRFAGNPVVVGPLKVRFYAGMPIELSDGSRVGALCVVDTKPRRLTSLQRLVLQQLSMATSKALESRLASRRLEELTKKERRARDSLRVVMDTVPAILAFWDEGLICRFANKACGDWLGIPTDSVVGKSFRDVVSSAEFEALESRIAAVLAGTAQTFERVLTSPAGDVNTLTQYVPEWVEGRVAGFLVHISDVTVLKKAQAELQREAAEREEAQRLGQIGSWKWQHDDNRLSGSNESCRIFGREPGFTVTAASHIEGSYTADSSMKLRAATDALWMTGQPLQLELEFIRADGATGWLEAHGEAVYDAAGSIKSLRGTVQEVTERHALLDQLTDQHALLEVTLNSIGDAVITVDTKRKITWLNPAAELLTGWSNEEAQGRDTPDILRIVIEDSRLPCPSAVDACLSEGVPGQVQRNVLISRSGAEFAVQHSVAPLRDHKGLVHGVVLVLRDVTEQRRLNSEMRYRATHDMLTGLTNRSEFELRLDGSLKQAQHKRTSHALMFIDLDQFKLVNDACGHAAGDQLLKQVSKVMGECIRGSDTLARIGGDEFAVILEDCTTSHAKRVAQQLCDKLDAFRFLHDGRRFRIGASIGLVPFDGRWDSATAALQAADDSCYAAKEAGRNRVHVWFDSDSGRQIRLRETYWASRLAQAVDEGRFVLFGQKIIPLGDGPAGGLHAEVLLRLPDTDGTLIAPGAFLPAAERFHICSRIDRWVLKQVVDILVAHPDLASVEKLCVNLSGQSIGDREFHYEAFRILRLAGPAVCQRLCLEITETAAVTNMTDAARFVTEVRKLGVWIALDDFGAGASSFGYLKSLAIDVLKIDGQYVRNVVDDRLDDAAVRCFGDIARVVGVKTVAEFVDSEAVLGHIKAIGVDYAQGYMLHRPEPLETVLRSTSASDPKPH
jgi:diguanylate cyclase (GGDEF)-like protein/PAS domain S-box-containing protein